MPPLKPGGPLPGQEDRVDAFGRFELQVPRAGCCVRAARWRLAIGPSTCCWRWWSGVTASSPKTNCSTWAGSTWWSKRARCKCSQRLAQVARPRRQRHCPCAATASRRHCSARRPAIYLRVLHELVEAHALVTETVTGSGGMGKTLLALAKTDTLRWRFATAPGWSNSTRCRTLDCWRPARNCSTCRTSVSSSRVRRRCPRAITRSGRAPPTAAQGLGFRATLAARSLRPRHAALPIRQQLRP